MAETDRIVFFDGVCNLCNGFIDFIVRTDRHHNLKVASLQGTTAQMRLPKTDTTGLSTVIFYHSGKLERESTAVAHILMQLPQPWHAFGALVLVVPRVLRDWAYRLVARSRYSLFGTRQTCRIPTTEERKFFLP